MACGPLVYIFYFYFQTIIDVGCGTGIISMMCARHAEPRKVKNFLAVLYFSFAESVDMIYQ